MSEQASEQTAIFAVVPTSVVPRFLELVEGVMTPQDTIEAIALPATREATAKVAGRLVGDESQRSIAPYRMVGYGDIVTPHPNRPTSLIDITSSGETVEAITTDNLRKVSKMTRGAPHVGGRLAGALAMGRYRTHSLLSPFMVEYQPHRTPLRAIRADQAPALLSYLAGDPPEQLEVSDAQRVLLRTVCELIEANPDEA